MADDRGAGRRARLAVAVLAVEHLPGVGIGLAARARDGTITQPELSGATFSIADLRPQGISRSSPVIRGGQAAILAVGASESAVTLTLACDNRILQGNDAAGFLTRMREPL